MALTAGQGFTWNLCTFVICLFAVHELLAREGPTLLDMRIKHLIKQKCVEKAAVLAKTCAEFPEFGGKKNFKQIYLVCLCETMSQQELMQEVNIFNVYYGFLFPIALKSKKFSYVKHRKVFFFFFCPWCWIHISLCEGRVDMDM